MYHKHIMFFIQVSIDDGTAVEEENKNTQQDKPLYKGALLTVGQHILLVLTFVFRHGLTGECMSDLLTLISLHCLTPNLCHTSLYLFRKYFANMKSPLVIHRFCAFCMYHVNKNETICAQCKSDLNDSEKPLSYFIEIPLAIQLQSMFKRKYFHEHLLHKFRRSKSSPNNIEDIYDGCLYKEQVKNGFLKDKNNISLMWYTDGIPLFKSSKFSIWPVYFSINELPFKLRICTDNMLFGGLWFGDSKPVMSTFLKPFHETLNNLYSKGVDVDCNYCKSNHNVKGIVLSGTCDLPARCIVYNMNQFNAEYGCLKCKQPGRVVSVGKGHTRVYPFDRQHVDGPYRNHEEFKSHGSKAVKEQKHVFGCKGPSWFSYLPNFDEIRGTAVDYMHGVLLGVVRKLLTLWFDSSHSKEPYSLSKCVNLIDKRLCSIKPPNFVTRLPRSIKNHLKYWKANECRSWLFYYSPVVLHGIMEKEYFEHYLLLVEAIHLLTLTSIAPSMIDDSFKKIVNFCCMFEVLYGQSSMVSNVHNLLHLPSNVRDLGPLWVYSCFPFEDFNGKLVRLFHGTQSPELQISYAVSVLLKLPALEECTERGTIVDKFYWSMKNKRRFKVGKEIASGIYIVGKLGTKPLTSDEYSAVSKSFGSLPGKILTFFRIKLNGLIIHSRKYAAVSKRISYMVIFLDDKNVQRYGSIEKYCKVFPHCFCNRNSCICVPKYFAIIKEFDELKDGECFDDEMPELSLTNFVIVKKETGKHVAVHVSNLLQTCVFMEMSSVKECAVMVKPSNIMECD